MVDIHNLKILDRDTRAELLQEYHESLDYLATKASGLLTEAELDERFINQEQARLTDPLAYYDAHVGKYQDIFRLIVTHPDMDHMTGLYRLFEQEKSKKILNFWHTGPHDFNLARTTEQERCVLRASHRGTILLLLNRFQPSSTRRLGSCSSCAGGSSPRGLKIQRSGTE